MDAGAALTGALSLAGARAAARLAQGTVGNVAALTQVVEALRSQGIQGSPDAPEALG